MRTRAANCGLFSSAADVGSRNTSIDTTAALDEIADKLRRIVDEHPESIIVLDHEGRVLLSNKAANEEIGSGTDLRGRVIVTGPVGGAPNAVVQARFDDHEFELALSRSTWYGQTAWLGGVR